jgi:hypothetical protein
MLGAWVQEACTSPPETFISCIDFVTDASPPGPSPPGPDPVNACHNAAKAFCDDHGFCKTCQAWLKSAAGAEQSARHAS